MISVHVAVFVDNVNALGQDGPGGSHIRPIDNNLQSDFTEFAHTSPDRPSLWGELFRWNKGNDLNDDEDTVASSPEKHADIGIKRKQLPSLIHRSGLRPQAAAQQCDEQWHIAPTVRDYDTLSSSLSYIYVPLWSCLKGPAAGLFPSPNYPLPGIAEL